MAAEAAKRVKRAARGRTANMVFSLEDPGTSQQIYSRDHSPATGPEA